MKQSLTWTRTGGAFALLLTVGVIADVGSLPAQKVMDQAARTEVIERLITNLHGYYVFPEHAERMEKELHARARRGDYATITSAEQFAAKLTADLRDVTHDRHLHIAFSGGVLPPQAVLESEAPSAESLAQERKLNFGVERAARLDFNLGYLDLRAFGSPEGAAGKFAAAMSLLADTDALVIDLRNNGGGDPATVALLASYLFDEKTRLNDIYDRPKQTTTQHWTRTDLAGPTYGGRKKVLLLISHDTFSAGEDFAYALKHLGRATLIGAATGGGAHPGSARRLTDHFLAFVPSGRSVSPITGTNWEGVGVLPDIAIDPDQALEKAQALYLADAIRSEPDEGRRARMAERLAALDRTIR